MSNKLSLRKQLIKSFMGVGAMYALSIPIGLITSIILARTLGTEAFGQYAFVMALLPLLALPVAAGLPSLLNREVAGYTHANDSSHYRGVVRAAHIWVIGVSLIVIAAYIVAGPIAGLLPEEGKWPLIGIVVLLIPLQGLNAVRNGTIKGLGYPAMAEMPTQIIQPLILVTVFSILAVLGVLTTENALWGQVLVGALTFIIASILFIRVRPRTVDDSHPQYQYRLWLYALLPFTLISLVSTLNAQVGIVLLGLMGSDEAVAALRVGERGAQFVALSLGLVNMVIAPHIVKTYREGNVERLQQLSRQSARGAFLFALPIGILLILLGKPILQLTFGDEYADASYLPMAILVIGQLFNVAMGSVGMLLAMSGHEKVTLMGQFIGLGATIITAVLLIPHLKEIGAALAVTVGLVVWNIVMGYGAARHLKIRPGIL